jgi:2-(1,2-epoxy-1,2-dihydrophenyl)acetyl-CoA isomerase
LEAQLTTELHLQLAASETDDFREGVAAFLEKRTPEFLGK